MIFKMAESDFPDVWKHYISIMVHKTGLPKLSYTFKLLMKPHLCTQIRGKSCLQETWQQLIDPALQGRPSLCRTFSHVMLKYKAKVRMQTPHSLWK